MDIQFFEPEDTPRPPDEVAFQAFDAEPLADGRRVRLSLRITPFQQRPSIDIEILDDIQQPVAQTSIVEAVDINMSLTMHLRGTVRPGVYSALAKLSYPPAEPVDQARIDFSIPAVSRRRSE